MLFKHSGDLGDIIYSLPVIKSHGKGKLGIFNSIIPLHVEMRKRNIFVGLKKSDGSQTGIDDKKFNFIKPLIENQKYICSVEKLTHIDKNLYDLDYFRLDKKSSFVYEKYRNIFDIELSCYELPWLEVRKKFVADIVISRTFRYLNYNFPWHDIIENYGKSCVFVGLPHEHDLFIKLFGYIPYYPVQDAYEMASIIKGSKLFIGNQSVAYAIAEGLKHNTIQETSTKMPDCIFIRENAKFFIGNKFVKLKYL